MAQTIITGVDPDVVHVAPTEQPEVVVLTLGDGESTFQFVDTVGTIRDALHEAGRQLAHVEVEHRVDDAIADEDGAS